MKEHFSIAIDGPGGAGKSTLAKAVAKKLNILHVDTGAIYRTIGYAAFAHTFLRCSATSRAGEASSWTGATSAQSFCRTPTSKFT